MTDALQKAALAVATTENKLSGNKAAAIDPTQITSIIQIIFDLITQCKAAKAAKLQSAASKPTLIQKLVLTSRINQHTHNRAVARVRAAALMDTTKNYDTQELDALIDDIHAQGE